MNWKIKFSVNFHFGNKNLYIIFSLFDFVQIILVWGFVISMTKKSNEVSENTHNLVRDSSPFTCWVLIILLHLTFKCTRLTNKQIGWLWEFISVFLSQTAIQNLSNVAYINSITLISRNLRGVEWELPHFLVRATFSSEPHHTLLLQVFYIKCALFHILCRI